MNNLSHKVAVASICTVLGFILGAKQEAKAVSITLQPSTLYGVIDSNSNFSRFDGIGDGILRADLTTVVLKGTQGETEHFAEFHIEPLYPIRSEFEILNFPRILPNIISAIFQADISSFQVRGLGVNNATNPGSLAIFGFPGVGRPYPLHFGWGVFITSVDISGLSPDAVLNFDVTSFIQQGVDNQYSFAGFGIRALNLGGLVLKNSDIPENGPRLIVEIGEVAEPVPEPTTIFGSAIALGVGGWLKRKKLGRQNKTVVQH